MMYDKAVLYGFCIAVIHLLGRFCDIDKDDAASADRPIKLFPIIHQNDRPYPGLLRFLWYLVDLHSSLNPSTSLRGSLVPENAICLVDFTGMLNAGSIVA